jgi:LytS/YehU family sensor histidine kinase
MPQANTFTLLSALISGVVSGVLVALLNYWLTRKKTLAEIKFIEMQAEKIQRELSLSVDNISAAVAYKSAGSTERIIMIVLGEISVSILRAVRPNSGNGLMG